jgi:hypothetical protein
MEDALALFVVERAGERRLGILMPQDPIALLAEKRLPFGIGPGYLECFGCLRAHWPARKTAPGRRDQDGGTG